MRPPSATVEYAGDAWDVVDRLLIDVESFARSNRPADAYWREMLSRAVESLAARGAVAWCIADEAGTLKPAAVVGVPAAPPASIAPTSSTIAAATARARCSCLLMTGAAHPDDAAVRNSADAATLAAPIVVDGRTVAVIEMLMRHETPPDACEGALRVVEALAESSAVYCREQQRRGSLEQLAGLKSIDEFLTVLYRATDVRSTAFALANEGQRRLGCDRLSVLVVRDGRPIDLAVSGVDLVDRAAPTPATLERLLLAAAQQHKPLDSSSAPADQPPDLKSALAEYQSVAGTHPLRIIPPVGAAAETNTVAWLAAENFSTDFAPDFAARLEPVIRHGTLALQRAAQTETAAVWQRRVAPFSRFASTPRRKVLLLALAVVAMVPFLIPADLTVEARGRWEPRHRRDLFASLDGIVHEVRVAHGDPVAADQVVVVLRSPELELELSRVLGEIESSQSRLASLRTLRTSAGSAAATTAVRQQELTAEEEQLKLTLAAREQELALLRARQAELQVRAPIAGRALTWNIEQRLAGRPVARGQLLLHVADVTGPWDVELDLPQGRVGDVLEAMTSTAAPPTATFVTAVDPEVRHDAKLTHVSAGVELDESGQVVVPAVLESTPNTAAAGDRRPGAVVTATIVCRRTTLAQVWWHELTQFVRSWQL